MTAIVDARDVKRVARYGLYCIACVIVVGCNADGLRIMEGRLVENGQPLKVSDKGQVVLWFSHAQNPDDNFPADITPDGNFKVVGPQRKGILPGSYRATVQQWDPYNTHSLSPVPEKDLLKGEFTGSKSPIVVELTGDGSVTIDMAQYKKGK